MTETSMCFPRVVFCALILSSAISGKATLPNLDLEEDTDGDYVPRFFGGRMNEEGNSGMLPPPRTNKHRSLVDNVRIRNITQKLDHFDEGNDQTWTQRYFINDAYLRPRPNGPIFITIGGEEEFDRNRLEDGPMVRLAKKHKALLLALEHRFYGESRPTRDASLRSLQYLSSRQALADLHNFIEIQRKLYRCKIPNPKIILYGCSYAGTLATYYTGLYPESTSGAISAFAPNGAIENFSKYFEGVIYSIQSESIGCMNGFLCAIYGLQDLIRLKDDEKLNEMIDLCEPKSVDYENPHAVDSLFYDLISILMVKAQYNRLHLKENSELSLLCRIMTDKTLSCTKKCAEWYGKDATLNMRCCYMEKFLMWVKEVHGTCIFHAGNAIMTRSINWNSDYIRRGTRQWLWQMCSEFGFFIATDAVPIFSGLTDFRIDLQYMKQTCYNSFGIQNVTENVARTNSFYEDILDKAIPHVFFLVSITDPWYSAFYPFLSEEQKPNYLMMQDVSHCYEPLGDGSDPERLVNGWKRVESNIEKWLKT